MEILNKISSGVNDSIDVKQESYSLKRESTLTYSGPSLRQPSEELRAQLQDRVRPTFSLPFILKGKMGLCLGGGLLSNMMLCTDSSYHRTKTSTVPSVPDKLSCVTMRRCSESYSLEQAFPQQYFSENTDPYRMYFDDNDSVSITSSSKENDNKYIVDLLRSTNIINNDFSSGDLKKKY